MLFQIHALQPGGADHSINASQRVKNLLYLCLLGEKFDIIFYS